MNASRFSCGVFFGISHPPHIMDVLPVLSQRVNPLPDIRDCRLESSAPGLNCLPTKYPKPAVRLRKQPWSLYQRYRRQAYNIIQNRSNIPAYMQLAERSCLVYSVNYTLFARKNHIRVKLCPIRRPRRHRYRLYAPGFNLFARERYCLLGADIHYPLRPFRLGYKVHHCVVYPKYRKLGTGPSTHPIIGTLVTKRAFVNLDYLYGCGHAPAFDTSRTLSLSISPHPLTASSSNADYRHRIFNCSRTPPPRHTGRT